MKTKYYTAVVLRGGDSYQLKWENTNRLLWKKGSCCIGMKTGITKSAGPCLASVFEKGDALILCIVLHSKSFGI